MSQSIQQLLEEFAKVEPGWHWQIQSQIPHKQTWQAGAPQPPTVGQAKTVWAVSHAGKMFGTLQAVGKKNGVLSAATLNLVEFVKPLLGEIFALRRQIADVENQASQDFLTGLLNRRGWEAALISEEARCRRHECTAAIVILDLDNLKVFNDTQGHAAGDELLQKTATCLRRAIRLHDVAARLGGDEFGLLFTEIAVDSTPSIAERMRKSLAENRISATFGAAERTKAGGLHDAWKKADQALIAAKRK